MGTFRVPDTTPSPSPPGSPKHGSPVCTPVSTPPASPIRKQQLPKIHYSTRSIHLPSPFPRHRMKSRKTQRQSSDNDQVGNTQASPTPNRRPRQSKSRRERPVCDEKPPPQKSRRERQTKSGNPRKVFNEEPPPQSRSARNDSAEPTTYEKQTKSEPDHEDIQYTPTPNPPNIPIAADERTHQSAPTTGTNTFSLPLIRSALYLSHTHRHRVVPTLGPPAQWNHLNPTSHPLPPSLDINDTLHLPNPFIHLPHPPYEPAGQYFSRNVREGFSRVDRGVRTEFFDDGEFDNVFVYPWFTNTAVNNEPRNPFSCLLRSNEERRENADREDESMMDIEIEEPLSFNHTNTSPPYYLEQPRASATLHVPVDGGDGVMEVDVPRFEGGGMVKAVWDKRTRTIKVTVQEKLDGM